MDFPEEKGNYVIYAPPDREVGGTGAIIFSGLTEAEALAKAGELDAIMIGRLTIDEKRLIEHRKVRFGSDDMQVWQDSGCVTTFIEAET